MTYEEFKSIVEANAMNDSWLFGDGWHLIHQYPEYADRMSFEHLKKSFVAGAQE